MFEEFYYGSPALVPESTVSHLYHFSCRKRPERASDCAESGDKNGRDLESGKHRCDTVRDLRSGGLHYVGLFKKTKLLTKNAFGLSITRRFSGRTDISVCAVGEW